MTESVETIILPAFTKILCYHYLPGQRSLQELCFYSGIVGTALAAVCENTKINGQFAEDDARIVPIRGDHARSPE